jgi:hypothetical protein
MGVKHPDPKIPKPKLHTKPKPYLPEPEVISEQVFLPTFRESTSKGTTTLDHPATEADAGIHFAKLFTFVTKCN